MSVDIVPFCEVCQRPVDRVELAKNMRDRRWKFTAHCHGEAESCWVDERDILSGQLLSGTAFRRTGALTTVKETAREI
jgi:hypothetical protein